MLIFLRIYLKTFLKAYEIIAEGLGNKGRLAIDYHNAERALEFEYSSEKNNKLEECRALLDKNDAWNCLDQIGKIMSKMDVDGEWDYDSLSGGQKRRVILAGAS